MRQRVASVRLADGTGGNAGTEVAYAVAGRGPLLLLVPGWLTHLEHGWALPPERALYESLARGRTLVRYDKPGCGLSGPCARPPSMDLELEALDAVVAATGDTGRLDVVGTSVGAAVAVRWAAAHPGRVRRLVLYGGWARGAEIADVGVREHVLGLVERHWGLGSDVLVDIFAPGADPAARAAFARYQRDAAEPRTARALLAAAYAVDVTADLGRVHAPTLVVHRDRDRAAPLAQGRALAAGIRDARLQVLPGRDHLPAFGDAAALVACVRAFLGLGESRGTPPSVLTPRQVEVARLVARGLTNREIADRLTITERTAESHVERIRARLGFRSRAQIGAWVAAGTDEVRYFPR